MKENRGPGSGGHVMISGILLIDMTNQIFNIHLGVMFRLCLLFSPMHSD